jgi:hypothetical protein
VLFFGPGEGWLKAVLAGFAGTLLFLALAYSVVAAAIALYRAVVTAEQDAPPASAP